MFGNIMNNRQIVAALQANAIRISPFAEDHLKKVHFPLTAGKILARTAELPDGSSDLEPLKDFTSSKKLQKWVLKPNEYVVVEIRERISMEAPFIGHFLPSSTMVTKGLGLTAGRIEAPFGDYGNEIQMVRFGVKNMTDMTTTLSSTDTIAYVYFVDLRGLDNAHRPLTPKEEERYEAWTKRLTKAKDDGPSYD